MGSDPEPSQVFINGFCVLLNLTLSRLEELICNPGNPPGPAVIMKIIILKLKKFSQLNKFIQSSQSVSWGVLRISDNQIGDSPEARDSPRAKP